MCATLRRLSFHRDGMKPPPPAEAVESERDFVELHQRAQRAVDACLEALESACLDNLYERASRGVAHWFESLPLDAHGSVWMSRRSGVGRLTNMGASSRSSGITSKTNPDGGGGLTCGPNARYVGAVIDVAVRGLPHAFSATCLRGPGQTVVIDISGPAGGQWTLVRETRAVELVGAEEKSTVVTKRIRLDDDAGVEAAVRTRGQGTTPRAPGSPSKDHHTLPQLFCAPESVMRVDKDDGRTESGWQSAQRHDILDLEGSA